MTRIYFLFLLFVCTSVHVSLFSQNNAKIDSLVSDLKNAREPEKKIADLVSLAKLLKDRSPEQAIKYAQEASLIAVTKKQKARAYIALAGLYVMQGEHKDALEYSIKANDLAVELDNDTILAKSYQIFAQIFQEVGDYTKSSDFYFKSLTLFEKLKSKQDIAYVLNGIGIIFQVQEKYRDALGYFNKSMGIMQEIGHTSGISMSLNNLAICYRGLGKRDSVEFYYRKALALNIKLGQKLWEGINYNNLAYNFLEDSKFDSCFSNLNKSIDVFNKIKNYRYQGMVYKQMSIYYEKTGNEALRVKYAHMALELAKKYSNLKEEIDLAEIFQDIYKSKGDFENAFYYSTLYNQIKDSLNQDESLLNLSRLEIKYVIEKREQELKANERQRNFIIIIIGIFLVLVVLFTYMLYARQKLKVKNNILEQQKLEYEVELKGKELVMNVMNLSKTNEILDGIKEKLSTITVMKEKQEIMESLHSLSRELEHTAERKILDEFEKRFVQVHGNFYDRLLKLYPDISPNEMKLCGFLRLNMSSKEISKLTGQQVRTIEIERHRLRKKLGLSHTQVNLISFLAKI